MKFTPLLRQVKEKVVMHEGKKIQLPAWANPKYALWPSGIVLVGAHIMLLSYFFSPNFVNDFTEDEEIPDLLKSLIRFSSNSQAMFSRIKNNVSTFLNTDHK
ncbi:hypothetical protein PGB90_001764 [Kerria lacca]